MSPGTALPVMVSSTLDSKKSKPGQEVKGRLMQTVTLPDGSHIGEGTSVRGRILQVSAEGKRSRLVVKFDRLAYHGKIIPFISSLRALA